MCDGCEKNIIYVISVNEWTQNIYSFTNKNKLQKTDSWGGGMLNVTINGSFLSSNIAVFIVFGGFVFQLIRYSRVCSSFGEFF
jgi:hypothetical protein